MALLAIGSTACGGGLTRPGAAPSGARTSDPAVIAAAMVQRCEAAHGLAQARVTVQAATGLTFASCEWPPGPGADPDGFTAIRVDEVKGPGGYEATGTDFAYVIHSPCPSIEASFSFGSQGAFSHSPPYTVRVGSIVTVDGKPWTGDSRTLGFYPARNDIVILHNLKNVLDSATCA